MFGRMEVRTYACMDICMQVCAYIAISIYVLIHIMHLRTFYFLFAWNHCSKRFSTQRLSFGVHNYTRTYMGVRAIPYDCVQYLHYE